MFTHHRLITTTALLCTAIALPMTRSAVGSPGGGLPAEKQALMNQIEQAHSDALAAPHAAKDLALPLAASGPEPAWITGIIDSGQAPLPGSIYEIINQWHDIVGSDHVNVYAGSERAHPEVGLVVVDATGLDLTAPGAGGIYPTPTAAGAVRIVEAARTTLVLETATGVRFVFDVATRAYL